MKHGGLWAALVLGALVAATAASHAQTYPANPIMLVNPYAAGGPADVLARPIAAAMGDILGQQVVILNKPGAATAIAAQQARARRPTATRCCFRPPPPISSPRR
jgi:tripartite-type tricarboxylate transporter receptor subunit TctC